MKFFEDVVIKGTAGDISFIADGTSIFNNGGSVGINTGTIGAAKLEIIGGSLQGTYIQSSGSIAVNAIDQSGYAIKGETSTGFGLFAKITNGSGTTGVAIRAHDQSGNIIFTANGDGNVGIGIATPSYNFHLKQLTVSSVENLFSVDSWGGSAFKIISATNNSANITANVGDTDFLLNVGGSGGSFQLTDTSYGSKFRTGKGTSENPGFLFTTGANIGSSFESGLLITHVAPLGTSGANIWNVVAQRIDVGATGTDSGNVFGLYVEKSGFTNTNATFYPAIFRGGNVGIETPLPTAKLHVTGVDNTSANYSLKIDDNTASSLFSVRNDGHITVPGIMEFTGSTYSIVNNTNALQMGFGNLLTSGTYAASYFNDLQLYLEFFNSTDSTGSIINMAGSDGSGGDGLSGSDSTYAEIVAFNFTSGYYSGMQMFPDSVVVKTVAPTFGGIKYLADHSANYTDLSLVTKGDLVNGIGNTQTFKGISSGFTGSQEIKKQAGIQTTNATVTTIATIASVSNQMIIVKGTMAGFRSTYAESYGATFFAVFYNNGGTLSQVSTTDLTEKYNFSGTPTTTITTSGTNILIEVTGEASTTINWVTTYEYSAVINNT